MRKGFLIIVALGFLAGVYWLVAPEIVLHYALQGRPHEPPKTPTIVMLGDSHTAIVDWPAITNCENIANLGVGGNTSAQMLDRIRSVLELKPRLVFIMAGTNDAFENIDPEITVSNLTKIEALLRDDSIEYQVVAPPPLPRNETAIRRISEAATLHVPFVDADLMPDKVHLKRSGYAKWRDTIEPLSRAFCSER
jgi:lysophospholipase L1-like esterase